MNKTIGFIGAGNMAKAMIGGIISSKLIPPSSILVTDTAAEQLTALTAAYPVKAVADNQTAAQASDILFLSVKPHIYPAVIADIKEAVASDCIIISIAPGLSVAELEKMFNKKIKLIRAMPNTPALVQAGMSALCPNDNINDRELKMAVRIFDSFSRTELVAEALMDTVVGVSGSSPAYIYILIEAMADAAVADGMGRSQAYTFAAQSVLGAAKMVLDTNLHPGQLKDMVCSPGGTTIEAVAALEQSGFRHSIITAQRACVAKSKKMGN